MAIVVFTSSSSFADLDPRAGVRAEVEISEYIEGTYGTLRHGDNMGAGTEFAWFINGAWELADGSRYSDWAVEV